MKKNQSCFFPGWIMISGFGYPVFDQLKKLYVNTFQFSNSLKPDNFTILKSDQVFHNKVSKLFLLV